MSHFPPSPDPGSNNMAKAADAFPTLVTRRLRLRRFEPHDAAGLDACFGDQDAMRFWNFPTCKTMAETEKTLRWLSMAMRTTSTMASLL
jgi:[ribosomal protein S5]-alanine N-acetyltransferase